MADYGLVVSAENKKGGTWAGATEELRRDNPKPVFVRTGNNVPPGNNKLIEIGAIAWPQNIETDTLKQKLAELAANNRPRKLAKQATLFDSIEKKKSPLNKLNKTAMASLTKVMKFLPKNPLPRSRTQFTMPSCR